MSPLANQDPLAKLNDIIAQTAPGWFPPAFIYWVLLIAIIAMIAGAYYFFKKYQTQQKIIKIQLAKLQQLQAEQANFIMLNQLIKGCALVYFPRDTVASLHGEQWFDFLQAHSDFTVFKNKQDFMQRLYQNPPQDAHHSDFNDAKNWIRALPKQLKKQIKKATKDV